MNYQHKCKIELKKPVAYDITYLTSVFNISKLSAFISNMNKDSEMLVIQNECGI